MVRVLRKRKDPEEPVEVEEVVLDFTMDCIARAVFSMDLNSPENPNNEFRKNGQNFLQIWRFIISMTFPAVCELFRIKMFNPKAASYFERVSVTHCGPPSCHGRMRERLY